jgi:two-component system OmpR family response regulator
MLPILDGLSVVKTLRGGGNRVPVLFLTALDGVSDRVDGLDAGADDYLSKPFAFSELLARVNALARRPPMPDVATRLKVGDLELDLMSRQIARGGREIDLQPQTYRLLEYLMRHAGQVWDFHFDPKTNVVETHISRLRAKLREGAESDLIHTIRGAGYVLRA